MIGIDRFVAAIDVERLFAESEIGDQPANALLDERMIADRGPGPLDVQKVVELGAVVIVRVGAERIDAPRHRVHPARLARGIDGGGFLLLRLALEEGPVELDEPREKVIVRLMPVVGVAVHRGSRH
jgi:hypothetical protein